MNILSSNSPFPNKTVHQQVFLKDLQLVFQTFWILLIQNEIDLAYWSKRCLQQMMTLECKM